LNFIKGREDPLALPEEDYPEWLWKILDSGKKGGEEGKEELGDEFCASFCSFFSLLKSHIISEMRLVEPLLTPL
jgi:Mitochondrial ribosomal protein L37